MLHWLRKLLGSGRPAGAGEEGERNAAAWLKSHRGFEIVAQNWRDPRNRRAEIDLVCREGDVLVFVEVKARADGALVPGYFAVDRRKKRALRRAIKAYLRNLRVKPRTLRFDVVEVSASPLSGAAPAVLHFENVPLFSKHFRA